MNWYKLALSQIYAEEITEDDLRRLYELEYKYNMIRTKPFKGMPKRQENIIARMEDELEDLVEQITSNLEEVYEKWLSEHAITDPNEWAEARTRGYGDLGDDSMMWNVMVGEYIRYAYGNPSNMYVDPSQARAVESKASREVLEKVAKANPSLFQVVINDWRNDMIDRAYEEVEYAEEHEEEYDGNTVEQIENMSDADVMSDFLEMDEVSTLLSNGYFDMREIVKTAYKEAVFPQWYGHWKGMGIDATRKTIEDTYARLMESKNQELPMQIAAINLALNAVHQTGDMVEYVQERSHEVTSDLLQELSELDTEEWDQELRETGVQL